MFDPDQLDALKRRLEDARAALRERRLDEQTAWRLRTEVEVCRREAAGSDYEQTLEVIADLVESLWRVTHARDRALRSLREPA
jgi:hypothetical protein